MEVLTAGTESSRGAGTLLLSLSGLAKCEECDEGSARPLLLRAEAGEAGR